MSEDAYTFRPGAKVRGVSADVAGTVLQRMLRKGPLTAERVLSAARPQSHPLHPAFEWDDAVAAEEHRLGQARHLIRSVRVVMQGGDAEPIAVHVTHEKCGGSAYVATADLQNDAELREAAVEEAMRLLNGVARRYRYLNELTDVWSAIEKAGEREPLPV